MPHGNCKQDRPVIAAYLGDVLQLSDDAESRAFAEIVPNDRTMEEIKGLFNFLEGRLGFDPKEIQKSMRNKRGILLKYTVEKYFDPVVSWLEEEDFWAWTKHAAPEGIGAGTIYFRLEY